ncbi:MAG: HPr family phosphocarrier protein [Acidobacteria bacterium]|nr:HPr family phosphocarrier protein [Acidobacteriota bacterium]
MIRKTLRIKSELGLHARAAAKLVKLTSQFESDIKLSRLNAEEQVDAKSILGILLMAAAQGTEIEVMTDGKDEEVAMEAVVQLVNNRFGEEK